MERLTRFIDERGVRAALTEDLRHEPREDIWNHLVRYRYVEEALETPEAFRELTAYYRELVEIGGGLTSSEHAAREPRVAREDEGDEMSLLADAAAREAAQDAEVQAFRDAALPHGVIPWADVHKWLEDRANEDGPPGGLLNGVPYDEGTDFDTVRGGWFPVVPIEISRERPASGMQRLLLAFGLPGEMGVRRMIVKPHGVLDGLLQLSETLSTRYNWQPALATVFILTGLTPPYSRAGVTLKYFSAGGTLGTRLQLEIDPSLPVDELVALYRSARKDLLAPIGGPKRTRPVSKKSIELARFAMANSDGTWEARMEQWNAVHPEDAYTERRNFQRDVTRILTRVQRTKR